MLQLSFIFNREPHVYNIKSSTPSDIYTHADHMDNSIGGAHILLKLEIPFYIQTVILKIRVWCLYFCQAHRVRNVNYKTAIPKRSANTF